jgi:hypothetical protein
MLIGGQLVPEISLKGILVDGIQSAPIVAAEPKLGLGVALMGSAAIPIPGGTLVSTSLCLEQLFAQLILGLGIALCRPGPELCLLFFWSLWLLACGFLLTHLGTVVILDFRGREPDRKPHRYENDAREAPDNVVGGVAGESISIRTVLAHFAHYIEEEQREAAGGLHPTARFTGFIWGCILRDGSLFLALIARAGC